MRGKGRRAAAALSVTGLAAMLVMAGCSAGDDSSSGRDSSAVAPAQGGAGKADSGGKVDSGGRSDGGTGRAEPGAGAGQVDLSVPQRAIIYTGSMTVRVDDVDAAADRATTIVAGAGGFVGGDQRSREDGESRATLQLRIPAERFQRVVNDLAALGEREKQELSSQDVTEETVDLDARIATQQARVASGRGLLARAKSLSDLVTLESEVAKREADLASLEAKKRRLADLTALSTVTVELLHVSTPPPASDDGDDDGFLAGLSGGWSALRTAAVIVLTVVGALLPFAVAIGLPVLLVWWLVRRRAGSPAPHAVPAARAPVEHETPVPAGTPPTANG